MTIAQAEGFIGKTVVIKWLSPGNVEQFRFTGDVIGIDEVAEVIVLWETAPAPGDEEFVQEDYPNLRTIPLEQVTTMWEPAELKPA